MWPPFLLEPQSRIGLVTTSAVVLTAVAATSTVVPTTDAAVPTTLQADSGRIIIPARPSTQNSRIFSPSLIVPSALHMVGLIVS